HQVELELQNEELRRAQVQLDAERARYFDLYDLAPVGYCTVSEQGLFLETNFTAATLLGVDRSELVKQPISRFILRQDQDSYYLRRKQLAVTGAMQSFELRMVRKDGRQIWAHLALTGAQDDGESVLRIVLSDVTDQKLMEAAMQESERRFRTLIEWAPEPIAVHRGSRLIYVNPAAIRMFGARSEQELIGKPILDLVHPDFHATVLARVKSTTLHGLATPMIEERFVRLDGTIIEVEAQSTSIVYDGAPAIQVAMRDITERKRLDAELRTKNAELERARSVAEKANLAKSDFLSSMSHELRSPLNAILGFAQLMESGSPPPTPTQQASIGQILQAGWYLLELINEILDLALIESGKLSLSLEPISLPEVLLDCQAMIEPQAQKGGIRISFPQSDRQCFVTADRTRLKQVLVNLLSNAIKYNRSGGTVDVTCHAVTAQRLRISVQDSGEGLSADKLVQLFQSFNRLGREAGAEQGTGIGLVVSKRLVELMAGEIGAQSTVGVGSVFWFELNLAAPPQLS
ncbi:MAG: PAS domain S-box protein, partial [Rhodoferax sp.]|nr:PAS domain S-box protein [Rhodoferax sp.]